MAKIKNTNALKQDFDNLARSLSRTIAHYTADKLTEKAKEVLAYYYADYDPIEYSRYNNHERTFQLLNKSAVRTYDNHDRYACIGGVRFAPENLYYPNKGASPLKTINSFLDGWHGGVVPMQTGPAAGWILRQSQKEIVKDICNGEVGVSLVAQAAADAGLQIIRVV